jgi:hypothetical protein
MIQAAPNPSSPFHSSHIFKFTDLAAPLSNNPNLSFGYPWAKKRKIADRGSDLEVECSTVPVALASESNHIPVHEIIKKECEELVELIVHLSIFMPFLFAYSDSM